MRKQAPFFSIITVTFNSAKTLEKCFKSLFSQVFTDWELIVIDGSSSDSTMRIIENHQNRISKIVSEKDSGIYEAMNKGAKFSKGEYLYFLNSDDQFTDKLVLKDIHEEILKKRSPSLLTANVRKIYQNFTIFKNKQLTSYNLKRGLMPPHQATFIKRTVFEQLGGYKKTYRSSGDFEFACSAFKNKIHAEYFNRLIAFFASGGQSSKKDVAYFETFSILKKYFGRFWANWFFFKKIIVEQQLKKILSSVRLIIK